MPEDLEERYPTFPNFREVVDCQQVIDTQGTCRSFQAHPVESQVAILDPEMTGVVLHPEFDIQ